MDANPRSGRSAKVIAAAVVVGLIGSGALVWQASSAAFTANTDNSGNAWSSGKVVISDDDNGNALFTANNLVPNATETKCIEVTYDGTVNATVKLFGDNFDNGDLAPFLDLDVSVGAGVDCGTPGVLTQIFGDASTTVQNSDDTLADFAADHTGWGDGAGNWSTGSTPGVVKPYVFKYTLANDSDAMDKAAAIDFIWEVQNN